MTARLAAAALAVCGLTALAPATAFAQSGDPDRLEPRACVPCHFVGAADGPQLSRSRYLGSVHGALTCTDCHVDAEDTSFDHSLPSADLAPVSCIDCHRDPAIVGHGGHGLDDGELNAGCADCHGSHDIAPTADPRSRVYPARVNATCGGCHETEYAAPPHGDPTAASGDAPIGRATCVDCHGGHDIAPLVASSSRVHAARVSGTCSTCHQDLASAFDASVHAPAQATAGAELPVCTTCHGAHGDDAARVRTTALCAGCHVERGETYAHTAHGIAALLGDGAGDGAGCADCHDPHGTRAASDPASRVHVANRVETCGGCHDDAAAARVGFLPHPGSGTGGMHPMFGAMRVSLALMLGLGFVGFVGHSALWWRRQREQPARAPAPAPAPVRSWRRLAVLGALAGLAVSGLPLRFPDAAWARALAGAVGGGATLAWLHRVLAAVAVGYALAHAFALWRLARRGDAPADRALPHRDDLGEVRATLRWLVGAGERPPARRWAYWEKLDLWTLVLGGLAVAVTGAMLWAPAAVTSVAPAWVLNLAAVIHAYVAPATVGFALAANAVNTRLARGAHPLTLGSFATWRQGEQVR